MIKRGPAITCHERALSEVIGFVLILGIITAAFSLYLVYGVPAQGRESEILHMNDIKDQFVSYKLSLDSLFNNNKVGTSVSNAFTLGTSGGFTQGSNSIIPILSPVSSSGVIAINQRTPTPETLEISSYSLIVDPNVHNTSQLALSTPTTITAVPQHIYINISNVQQSVLNPSTYYGLQVDGTGWTATVNLSPRMVPSQVYSVTTQSSACPPGTQTSTSTSGTAITYYCLNSVTGTLYNGSDISISVFKNGKSTLQSIPVYRAITPGSYSVDIMDPAYGIQPIIQVPDTLTLKNTLPNSTAAILGSSLIVNGFTQKNYNMSSLPLGSLEYRAKNNYWIPQNYYYQMGGIFLEQSDGNITWKLPPEISFSNDPTHNLVIVNINALALDNSSSGIVGGNSPVQVKTTLNSITPLPFALVAQGTGNTKWIRIDVTTTDVKAQEMWQTYFNYTAMAAGIPNTQVGTSSTGSFIIINGPDANPDGAYDINVIASTATYMPSIHGVGGSLQ
ncbi:hypothetical protein [Methanoregula sp. UBA64]|jgi:hypothetical protein|uniref:hypothetical protein n=1 Tax=Methanoregula sp. UBA64 TaxID=1915554 RepID=UPI0025CEB548|nr:hypothetical protein [Methanoregula sp. UBA64]